MRGRAENERYANRETALMFPIVTSVWTATESASSSATVGIISIHTARGGGEEGGVVRANLMAKGSRSALLFVTAFGQSDAPRTRRQGARVTGTGL